MHAKNDWGVIVELRHLEHFVAVVEESSFTRAAARLRLVQSALSVSVRSLERELGGALLSRTTHRVELTDAGRALLPEARQTLAAAQAARDAVAEVHGGTRGTLRLGILQAMTIVDLASLLTTFHRDRPAVDIQPRAALGGSVMLADELRQGHLDAAFLALPADLLTGLSGTFLVSEPMMLACPPEHPLAARDSVTIAELAGEVFIELPAGFGARIITDRAFAGAGVARQVAVEVGDAATFASLIRAGLGIGVIPPILLPDSHELAWIPIASAPTLDVALAVPAGHRLSAATRAFVDLVMASYPAARPLA